MTNAPATATFDPVPSVLRVDAVQIGIAPVAPKSATAIGVPVGARGGVGETLGVDRKQLKAAGFDATVGSTVVVPGAGGGAAVAVGIGESGKLDVAGLRNAAAAFARAASSHARLAFSLDGVDSVAPEQAAQAVVEGVLLARYSYDSLRSRPRGNAVTRLTIVGRRRRQAVADRRRRSRQGAWPPRPSSPAISPTRRTATSPRLASLRSPRRSVPNVGWTSRSSTRRSSSRWAAAVCSASTGAAPRSRG